MHRDTEHRQSGLRGEHAWQVRGTACASDDDLQAARCGVLGVFEQEIRRAVCGDHAGLVGDAEALEHLGRCTHRLPVGARAHNDTDPRFHRWILAEPAGFGATRPGRGGGGAERRLERGKVDLAHQFADVLLLAR